MKNFKLDILNIILVIALIIVQYIKRDSVNFSDLIVPYALLLLSEFQIILLKKSEV